MGVGEGTGNGVGLGVDVGVQEGWGVGVGEGWVVGMGVWVGAVEEAGVAGWTFAQAARSALSRQRSKKWGIKKFPDYTDPELLARLSMSLHSVN